MDSTWGIVLQYFENLGANTGSGIKIVQRYAVLPPTNYAPELLKNVKEVQFALIP